MKKAPKVLAVDIGGTSVKMLATGQTERRRFPSGRKLTPEAMVPTSRAHREFHTAPGPRDDTKMARNPSRGEGCHVPNTEQFNPQGNESAFRSNSSPRTTLGRPEFPSSAACVKFAG